MKTKNIIIKRRIITISSIEFPIFCTRDVNAWRTGKSEEDVNIIAAGSEKIKNIRSSTLVRVIREAALPGGIPLSISIANLTYPPPRAVGLTAAPKSHPTTILKISPQEKWVPKNRVQSMSLMLLVIQGTRARQTARRKYSKENSFKI